jgi:glucosylceramidase
MSSMSFAAQLARYLRSVNTGYPGSWWSISELSVYQGTPPAPALAPGPVAISDPNFRVQAWWSSEQSPRDGAWYQGPMPILYRLDRQPDLALRRPAGGAITTIAVDPARTYQTIHGIGASLEESTVYNLARMSAPRRAEVLRALVDPVAGIGMNLMRLPFGTSDFTGRAWYSYADTREDLSDFSIQKDLDYNIIAVIKEAQAYNPSLKFIASPWSPPGWMKTSGSMVGGSLKPGYYQRAAQYYRKAIQAYEAQGIPIYAFTLQNEPGVSTSYPSCTFTWEQQRDFVKHVAGEFAAHGVDARILILDHNFDMAMSYAANILRDPGAYDATDGVAFHDYGGEPDAMSELHRAFPDKEIFFTERSLWGTAGVDRLAQYFRNWSTTYNAWVSMLDSERQPNNGPFVPDPTLVIQSASNPEHYWLTPEYYLTGQVSRFVQVGARRIASDYGSPSSVTSVAFLNPDGTIVLVLVNQTVSSQPLRVTVEGNQIVGMVPPQAVATWQWLAGVGHSPY